MTRRGQKNNVKRCKIVVVQNEFQFILPFFLAFFVSLRLGFPRGAPLVLQNTQSFFARLAGIF